MRRGAIIEAGLGLLALGLLCLALAPFIIKAKAAFAFIAVIERGFH